MLRDELVKRLGEVDVELGEIASYSNPTEGQVTRTKKLCDEIEDLRRQIADIDRRQDEIRAAHDKNVREGRTVAGASFGVINRKSNDELFRAGRGTTDDALRAVDMTLESAVEITGRSADAATATRTIVERNPNVADYIRTTANPDYQSAFGKYLMAGDAALALMRMTDGERAAFAAVADAESRTALYTGSGTGGLAVPLLLDPSVIYTGNGNANPIRQISRIVTGISNKWDGVSSAGITASWDAEGAEVSDDTPTLANPEITAYKGQAFAAFSVELEGDWAGLMNELTFLFGEAKADLESTAFATGSSSQPQGIITALVAGSGTVANVAPGTDGALFAADLYNLFKTLPPRYRPNASWLMSLDAMNEVRALGDDKLGNQTVQLKDGYNFPLLGRPAYDHSGFSDFSGTTGVANIMVVGDFRNYVVFDRVGTRVELVQHLLHTDTNLPNGTRGAVMWFRTGADSTNDNAFRLLRNV
jgi:HK97 family phage major capsid protein